MTTPAAETTASYRTHLLIQVRRIGVGATNARDCISPGIPPRENVRLEERTTIQAVEIIALCKTHRLPRVSRTGGGVQYAKECTLPAIHRPVESVLVAENTGVVETIS